MAAALYNWSCERLHVEYNKGYCLESNTGKAQVFELRITCNELYRKSAKRCTSCHLFARI